MDYHQSIDDTTRIGDYIFISHAKETGRKGHYDETLYEAWLKVMYADEIVLATDTSLYPIQYLTGDFNGDKETDLFVDLINKNHIAEYWIVEFDGSALKVKKYFLPFYD